MVARAKSKGELVAHLKKRGIDDDVAAAVVFRLQEAGLINDLEFAHAWAQSRHRAKKVSKRIIAGELRQKGVAQESIDIALDEIDGEAEFEMARSLAERKLASLSRLDKETQLRRIQGLLARKGFGFDLISRVARDLGLI